VTLYQYRAARSDGAILSGQLAATSAEAGTLALSERGLLAIELSPARDRVRRRYAPAESALAFRSIASLVKVGLPLERAVALTEPLMGETGLRNSLSEVRLLLHQGKTLAEALSETPALASATVANAIRAGEQASRLGLALELVATQLEKDREIIARLRQALAYPMILLVTGSVSVALIVTVVLPRFATILADAGGTLPPLAGILLGLRSVAAEYWLVAWMAPALAGTLLFTWLRTASGRLKCHALLLRAPVIGVVRHDFATARLTRALATSLAAGLPILPAVASAADAASDEAIRGRVLAARDRIAKGEPLSRALSAEDAVTATAGQILAVGESSGQLAAMSERAADFATGEAERRLTILTRMVEPALVLLFGGLLALVAGALLQTVYSLRPGQ
jgi:type II secretory pathway component PulF